MYNVLRMLLGPTQTNLVLPALPWDLSWDFWLAFGTLMLALFTFALDVLTLIMVTQARRTRLGSEALMEEMRKHAERSAEAAVRSAAATQALVEVGQRPWLSLRSLRIAKPITASNLDCTISLTSTLHNFGETPALQVLARYYYLVTESQFPDKPDLQLQAAITPIPLTIWAKAEQEVSVDLRLEPNDLRSIADSNGSLYFYGVIEYEDGMHKKHSTQWSVNCETPFEPTSIFSLTGRFSNVT